MVFQVLFGVRGGQQCVGEGCTGRCNILCHHAQPVCAAPSQPVDVVVVAVRRAVALCVEQDVVARIERAQSEQGRTLESLKQAVWTLAAARGVTVPTPGVAQP